MSSDMLIGKDARLLAGFRAVKFTVYTVLLTLPVIGGYVTGVLAPDDVTRPVLFGAAVPLGFFILSFGVYFLLRPVDLLARKLGAKTADSEAFTSLDVEHFSTTDMVFFAVAIPSLLFGLAFIVGSVFG